jgi:hypothetical protein
MFFKSTVLLDARLMARNKHGDSGIAAVMRAGSKATRIFGSIQILFDFDKLMQPDSDRTRVGRSGAQKRPEPVGEPLAFPVACEFYFLCSPSVEGAAAIKPAYDGELRG